MQRTLQDILHEVEDAKRKYNEHMQQPCAPSQVAALATRTRNLLGIELPNEYADFLGRTDGLDFNGAHFYGHARVPIAGRQDVFIDDLVEMNLIQREVEGLERLLVLGQSGLDIYVYDADAQQFQARDRISLDVDEEFPTFVELLAHVVEQHR